MSSVIIEKQQIYKAVGVVCMLLVGFFTWLVIITFNNKSTGEITLIKVANIESVVRDVGILVKDNNKILQTKADALENNQSHERIQNQIDLWEIKLHEYRAGRSYGTNIQSSFPGYLIDKPSTLIPIILDVNN